MRPLRVESLLLALACLVALILAADSVPRKEVSRARFHYGQLMGPPRPHVEPVDINSAGKAELMKLPGISEDDADRLIAGRPYLSKAHLQTHNIISPMQYQGVRELVVARQKDAKFEGPVDR